MSARLIAEALHAGFGSLDTAQAEPERRAREHAIQNGATQDDGENDVVVLRVGCNAEPAHRRKWHVRHAVVATGERRPAHGDSPHDVAKGNGDENEVDAARAHGKTEDET